MEGKRFLTVLARAGQNVNSGAARVPVCEVRVAFVGLSSCVTCTSQNQININDCFKNHICTFLLCCTCLWLVLDDWVCFSLLCFIAHSLTRALRSVQFLRDLCNSKGANKE